MAIQTYIVPTDRIIHKAKVDFSQRCMQQKTIHIVQYDKSLPVIAVELFLNGSTYMLPANADVKIRWSKRDKTFVYKNVLGCDENRQIVYFDVDEQMTFFNGPCNPILEVIISGNKAGSSSMPFEIDRNPIQVGDIESHSIYPELEVMIEKAEEAAETASEAVIKAVGAEAWAVGTIDGVPVPDYDPRYHNNSKWYAEQAGVKSEHVDSVSNEFDKRVETAKGEIDIFTDENIAEIDRAKNAGITEINTIKESSKTEISTIKEQVKYEMEQKAEQTIESIPSDYTELSRRVDHKADIDGYYEGMGVGRADNLISPDGITDTPENDEIYNPFVLRSTAGSRSIADGNAVINEIRGNNLKWNQMSDLSGDTSFGYQQTVNGMDITFYDGYMICNGTATDNISIIKKSNIIKNHKYINKGGKSNAFIRYDYYDPDIINLETAKANNDYYSVTILNGTTYNNKKIPIYVIDLTSIFGVDNEPTDVNDSRVQFLINYAKLHPEYNTGSILSVKPESMKAIGFNAWDEQWESGKLNNTTGKNVQSSTSIRSKNFIKVVPGMAYYFRDNSGGLAVNVYDSGKNWVKYLGGVHNELITIPNNVHYIRFYCDGTTYNNDICINLSWSGYRNGEYEPHKEFNRDLPVLRYFPDGMNGINGVYDVLNFKTKKGIRRFGIVDLGTLDWKKGSGTTVQEWYVNISDIKYYTYNLICSHFISTSTQAEGTIYATKGNIRFYTDKYSTTDDIKTAMSGVILIYELTVPEEFDIDPHIDTTYEVSDFGTEEFVGGDTLPVPCEIFYQDNLRDKLRNLNSLTEDELQEILDLIH